MNRILSIIFFVGLVMIGVQGFIRGAHAQCYNCDAKQESLIEPEPEGKELHHEIKKLDESVN